MAASAAHDATGLMHTRIHVLAEDAAAARDESGRWVFSRAELDERAVMDPCTGAQRILVHPSAEAQCKALRAYFHRYKPEPGFHDVCGGRYSWSVESKARAHFARWPCEHDLGTDKTTGPLSEAHEVAIDQLCELISRDDLKVIQTCTCATHKSHPDFLKLVPQWAQHYGENPYITDWKRSTFGRDRPGYKLVKGWKWHPDPSKKAFFVLDLAVLDNQSKLLWAIEVQHTHANSAKKREAFEVHKVTHLQLDAKEVLSVCTRRDWVRDPPYPPLHHHAVDATERWACPTCTTRKLADEESAGRERAERERERVARKRKADADAKKAAEEDAKEDAERASKRECRNAYFMHMGKICREWNAKQMRFRKKWLTTYNKPVNGRVLRGRATWMSTKADDGCFRLFLVNDSWSFLILTRDESLRTRWERYHKEKSILHVQVWDAVPADAKYGVPPNHMLPSFMMYDDKDGVERPIGIRDLPPVETMEQYYERNGVELEEA